MCLSFYLCALAPRGPAPARPVLTYSKNLREITGVFLCDHVKASTLDPPGATINYELIVGWPPGGRYPIDMTVKLDKLRLPPNERHIMSRSAITIVKNFGTADYRYQDRHVDDTQGTESFLAVRNLSLIHI